MVAHLKKYQSEMFYIFGTAASNSTKRYKRLKNVFQKFERFQRSD